MFAFYSQKNSETSGWGSGFCPNSAFPCLTGKRFRLDSPTLGIEGSNGKRQALYVPAGAVIKVLSGPTSAGDGMVDVLWDSKIVTMFAIDVTVRGAEVLEESASA